MADGLVDFRAVDPVAKTVSEGLASFEYQLIVFGNTMKISLENGEVKSRFDGIYETYDGGQVAYQVKYPLGVRMPKSTRYTTSGGERKTITSLNSHVRLGGRAGRRARFAAGRVNHAHATTCRRLGGAVAEGKEGSFETPFC